MRPATSNRWPDLSAETKAEVESELARIRELRSSFIPPNADLDAETSGIVSKDSLREMAALQHLFFEHHFATHRLVTGAVIIAVKKIAVAVFNRVLRICLVRQVELNQHNWNVALSVYLMEERLRRVERLLEEMHGKGP